VMKSYWPLFMVSKKIWLMLSPIGNYLLTIWQIIATGKQFGKRNQKGCVLAIEDFKPPTFVYLII
ncbi:hypothetical protein, partial [Klebsiella pneumoniae]|uniref:hypothetical protein n=1 Tax=Klebsiella pneumoniae TaxID=573 RepID=UPI003F8E4F2D